MDVLTEINVLISHIIDQKQYSHCRLCLKFIEDDNFARFDDGLLSNDDYFIVYDVLTNIFGEEVCEQIPGINAVCNDCIKKSIETLEFINTYKASTLKLNKVIDNLNSSLNIHSDISVNQELYIECGEYESKLTFIQNPTPSHTCDVSDCNQSFETIDELNDHCEEDHRTNTCKKCSFTSENLDNILDHDESVEAYQCSSCPEQRCTKESLEEHIDENHNEHICKKCGKIFGNLKKLLKHEETHTVSSYNCSKCNKSYVTKQFYTKHVTLCLENKVEKHPHRSRLEKRYFCKECGKGYNAPGGLRVHKRFVHENAQPHICMECGKKFTAPCYLKAHMITHTKERNFPCDLCGGKFVTREALLYHVRRHTGERPYSCNQCDEKFVNASARAEHIKFKHVGPTLRCEICSRMFVTKNFLKLHMKKHNDPANKLYIGRANVPPNMPGEHNMKIRIS